MRSRYLITATLLLGSRSAAAQSAPADSIHRLSPASLYRVPAAVRQDLLIRGCLVPQPWDERLPKNAIRGAFTASGANEWAVLCSVRDSSRILIYRVATNAATRVVDSLARTPDGDWMQGIGGGRMGYSRLIQVKPRKSILAWRTDDGGRTIPNPIDHDAIEQIFLDKSAEAFYRAGGRWYRRITAD